MPSISSCPACHRDLTIPDLADRQQPLRCPLCDAQFAAERVLADCVSFPPAAIVVGDEPSPVTSANSSVAPAPAYTFGDEPATAPSSDLAWPSPASSAIPAMEEPSMPPTEPAKAEPSTEGLTGDSLSLEAAAHEAAVAEGPGDPGLPSGSGSDEEATDYESFGRQVAAMQVAPKARRQASAWGALGQLLGMALGGVLGLAIGYYVLIWIGGPRADFLELRAKLPRWLLPPARRHNAVGDAAPLAGERSRADRPSRTLADLINDPDLSDGEAATPDSDVVGLPSGVDAEETRERDSPPIEPQPVIIDCLAAGSEPLPDGYRGPRGFKLRSAEELQAALEQADRALRCPHCQMPGAVRLAAFDAPAHGPEEGEIARRCDYCRGKPVLNVTAAAFEQLCGLGEAVTFVQFAADDPSRPQLRDAAETILMSIGSQRDKSEIIGRLAAARLDDSGRQTNGIVVAGSVQQAGPAGEFFAIQLMLFGSGKSVTVVSRQPPEPPVSKRDRLVVLGSIIDSPAENLVGYTGKLSQVVWGGLHLKLAAAAP